jgi:hypothetical protein
VLGPVYGGVDGFRNRPTDALESQDPPPAQIHRDPGYLVDASSGTVGIEQKKIDTSDVPGDPIERGPDLTNRVGLARTDPSTSLGPYRYLHSVNSFRRNQPGQTTERSAARRRLRAGPAPWPRGGRGAINPASPPVLCGGMDSRIPARGGPAKAHPRRGRSLGGRCRNSRAGAVGSGQFP